MPYNVLEEDGFLSIMDIHERLPGSPSVWTIRLWIIHGYEARNGQRVFLEGIRVGKRWFVKRDNVEAFVRRINEEQS
jgi:hypothetical protein